MVFIRVFLPEKGIDSSSNTSSVFDSIPKIVQSSKTQPLPERHVLLTISLLLISLRPSLKTDERQMKATPRGLSNSKEKVDDNVCCCLFVWPTLLNYVYLQDVQKSENACSKACPNLKDYSVFSLVE